MEVYVRSTDRVEYFYMNQISMKFADLHRKPNIEDPFEDYEGNKRYGLYGTILIDSMVNGRKQVFSR